MGLDGGEGAYFGARVWRCPRRLNGREGRPHHGGIVGEGRHAPSSALFLAIAASTASNSSGLSWRSRGILVAVVVNRTHDMTEPSA